MASTTSYNEGGWIAPPSTIAVTIHPDECILVLRDGDMLCCRGLTHGAVNHTADQVTPPHTTTNPSGFHFPTT